MLWRNSATMHTQFHGATTAASARWRLIGLVCLLICLMTGVCRAAEDQPGDEMLQMIVDLLSETDRDMRAIGLQQVREEAPGEAATKRFVALLPKLPPDGRAALLEALGERGDAAARPAVLEMLDSQEPLVRTAALRALGGLGADSDAPLLARKTAEGSDAEREAARRSLIQLRGEGVNAAIVATLKEAEPTVSAELLKVLAARNAKETVPVMLETARHADPQVRLAALGALRFLADENNDEAMVAIVKSAKDDAERRKAELALLVICSRGREACADAIIAGLADADTASRIALLHALSRAGGAKSLQATVARLDDEDEAVRDEAVRMLSSWPDPAVAPRLLEIAGRDENLRHQVLAVRGLVRLASPQKEKPADLKLLREVMKLALRPQEKRLVLGTLGGGGDAPSLTFVAPTLDDPALAEEAALAAVMIAERSRDGAAAELRGAMEKVVKLAKDKGVRDRAQRVLQSLN